MLLLVAGVSVLLVLASCAHKYHVLRDPARLQGFILSQDAQIFVAVADDGYFGETRYHNSGVTTTMAIVRAFSAYTRHLEAALEPVNLATTIERAKAGGYEYLVWPMILHWEDRASEWSGIPDRISLRVAIIDVSTGSLLDSTIISAESRVDGGFSTSPSDLPEDLLKRPLADYASQLFAREVAPSQPAPDKRTH
jgi:hypothetical protein